MTPLEIIAHNIRYHRIRLGLSQRQMAEMIYVSRSTLSSYELEVCEPNIITLIKLRKIFGLNSVEELVNSAHPTAKKENRESYENSFNPPPSSEK
jgi:DNA-binding XRE family transcriptional regulator